VRFVVRLAIAIATLVSSAILCWGQQPLGVMSGGGLGARPSAWDSQEPSLAPPDSVEGAWVADDDVEPVQPPGELGLDPFQIDQSMAQGGCGCEACAGGDGYGGQCADGSCGDGYGDPNAGAGHGHGAGCGWFAPLWCSDLWNEVHAHRRTYVEVDYLSMWTKGNYLPPLVTTSPIGTPQAQAGRLPVSATTEILFGDQRVDDGQRNGGRINVGYWLIDGEFLGIEGQYFTLEQATTQFGALSQFSSDPGAQILARPFMNVDPLLPTPTEDAAIVAFPNGFVSPIGPGTLDGFVTVRTTSGLQSAGALLRRLVWIDFTMQRRVDLLMGYRFLRIDDSVTINDQSTFIPDGGGDNVTFASQDQFSARNLFNGGEIGLKAQGHHGRLSVELIAKCAFGNNQQLTYINGYNSTTVGADPPVDGTGGLLAQPTNMGNHERNVFAILPEANANLKWDVTCNIRATLGYTFLYINRVQRSGNAIDLDVNPTQFDGGTLVGTAAPAFVGTDDTWWAHGVTGGIEYRW